MTKVLDVKDLKTYFHTRDGVVKAVDGVSFSLEKGEILGLVGESGSGKTVTGFSLLGLVDAPGEIVGGRIELNGENIVGLPEKKLRAKRGKDIAMIFQDPIATLNPLLTIRTQMALALEAHARFSNKEIEARCIEVLNKVGIPDPTVRLDNYPHEFSGGMRQRVAIAITLLHSPGVIVADEPTTALDVSIQAQILSEMRTLAKETGTAMIWISHDLATVSSLATRLLVMYAGRVVEEGPTAQVLKNPHHPYTQGLIESLPAMATPGEPLVQISGTTPSLLSLPPGCPFAPRCSFSTKKCATEPLVDRTGDRAWRCHHPLQMKEAV
ncbi:ABC transporter ATP-binding protein [Sneathiella aquimaris]|uniref:ABC transporter ATP-binding protein n=1 Tax=Sneathiella aquimaris TaxID=2599305 RepID=UPI00146C2992|nr:ABC transporter ATP-binding protein [Sneathiella aquimaris]